MKWIINRSDTTMEELDIFEFDPLSSQSAGSYVKYVMPSMVGHVIIKADIHNEPVSNCKLRTGTGKKIPLEVDVCKKNVKKLKSDDQDLFH